MRVPIFVYADFECFTEKIDTCQPDPDKSYTKKFQKHVPSGFCFYIVCNGKKLKPILCTRQFENEEIGKIVVEMFQEEIGKFWSTEVKTRKMTEDDMLIFEEATKCGIYGKTFNADDKRFEITAISAEYSEVLLTINVTCFSENRSMCQ